MNCLIGDSRVLSIKNSHHARLLIEVEDIWGRPGLKLNKCNSLVENNIILHHPPIINGQTHYYIMAGICDVTCRLKHGSYEEVIFQNKETTINNTTSQLDRLSEVICRMGAKPIFCTIPPMSLQNWNNNRLKQRKTISLNFQDQYARMQKEMEEALEVINSHIININKSHNMHTPLLHTALHRRRRGKAYTMYELLKDGCHPGNAMAKNCVDSIKRAIAINNQLRQY